MQSGDTEGNITFSIAFSDTLGNAGTTVTTTTNSSSVQFDKTTPVITQSTPVPTPTADSTPNYRFSSFEPGIIVYGGDCSSIQTNALGGITTVTFNTLANGTYTNCTIRISDSAGNLSNTLAIPSFTIDASAPTITEVTAVPTPGTNTAPEYTFDTTEAGTITYGGSCSSATTSATLGNNTITFDTLVDGIYADCTIIVTDALGNASNILTVTSFTIDTDPAALFVIVNPTDDFAGNPVTVTVQVRTIADALDTSYQNDVLLVTSGSATGGGLVDIINGVGTMIIEDAVPEIVALSLVDSQTTGLDVSSTEDIVFTATAAVVSHFVIIDPVDGVTRRPTTVIVKALKTDDTIDTTYQRDVTLVTSGSATGGGLVNVIDGVGTISITDTVSETVLLSLVDSDLSGLDVSSTQSVFFRRGGGGGVQVPPTLVQFSGRAYHDARITITTKDKDSFQDVIVKSHIVDNAAGVFSFVFNEMPIKTTKTYGLAIIDADGRPTQTKLYTLDIIPEKTAEKKIFAAPTVTIKKNVIPTKEIVEIEGFATPGTELTFELDGKPISARPRMESGGFYYLFLNAAELTVGSHTIRARQIDYTGIESDYSLTGTFTISDFVPETDLNGDGAVTITDWSIFLQIWGSDDTARRKLIDFSKDGKVTVTDLSIFIQTMR